MNEDRHVNLQYALQCRHSTLVRQTNSKIDVSHLEQKLHKLVITINSCLFTKCGDNTLFLGST